MKQKLSCLTLSIALLALSNWCNAANRYVSAGSDGDGLSWATAKGSIKSAVEAATQEIRYLCLRDSTMNMYLL